MTQQVSCVSVIGLGKLGMPMAACFASKGLRAIGVDHDANKVRSVNDGLAPLYEPRLQELMTAAGGRLTATHDLAQAVAQSDASFVVVPTPSDPDGRFSLRFVLEAMGHLGTALRQKSSYHLVVLTSTVMPGSTGQLVKPLLESTSSKRCGKDFGLCYSPEFIALGSVIRDFLNPDFTLIGESDPVAGDLLTTIYSRICESSPPSARMNFVNAELTKIAVNTYVTSKITFANMLARICERLPEAHIDVVTSALGLDARIGPKYLRGAIGYGGPCFPRDNIALSTLARALGAPALLAEATDAFNRRQITWLEQLVRQHLPPHGVAGILGLAYKPHSDVIEEAPGVLLTQALIRDGYPVAVYDPAAGGNARKILDAATIFPATADECVRAADVVVVTTPWDEFKHINLSAWGRPSHPRVVIDCWRCLGNLANYDGVTYIPLGIGTTVGDGGLEPPAC